MCVRMCSKGMQMKTLQMRVLAAFPHVMRPSAVLWSVS